MYNEPPASPSQDSPSSPPPKNFGKPAGFLAPLPPTAPPNFLGIAMNRADLALAAEIGRKTEIIAKATTRETTRKFQEWIRDEIARAYQDEHPGEDVPQDAALLEWALSERFHGFHVVDRDDPPHIRRYILQRAGAHIAGLELNVMEIQLTPEEAAELKGDAP